MRRGPGATLLVGAGLIAATLVVYAQVAGFDFVNIDDQQYVENNRRVLAGPTRAGLAWALTTHAEANWHPLTWISLMLDARIGGPGPRLFHLTNLALHAANTLLLFGVLAVMTGSRLRSGFVAALFAIHPLHVESVAWISERKDVLSAFFGLLALSAYLRYVRRPGLARYLPVGLAFALGLMAKPMLVTLPLAMLLFDYWPLRRVGPGTAGGWLPILEKLPLLGLSVVSGILTLQAQLRGDAVNTLAALPLDARVANAVVSYVTYLTKMLWPTELAVFYPHPRDTLPLWQVSLSALALAGVTALAWAGARRRPYLAVGWLWYLVTLLPVIGLLQVGAQAMADRYTYLPLVGPFIAIAWGVPDLLQAAASPAALRRRTLALSAVALVAILLLVARAHDQVGYWRDGATLFRHALRVTTDNARAHNGLGMALSRAGELERAVEHFREALRLDPAYPEAHDNLAAGLALQGKTAEAIEHFREALRLRPQDASCHANFGTVLMRRGDLDDAAAEFAEAIRLDPDHGSAHNNLGVLLARRGDVTAAIEHFEEALRIAPDDAGARANLERARGGRH